MTRHADAEPRKDPLTPPLLVSKLEAARLLSISSRTLDNLLVVGELRPVRVGRRVLFSRASLERFARGDHAIPKRETKKDLTEASDHDRKNSS